MGEKNRIILIAVDASENSRSAFDWYLNNMKQASDYVYLYHIFETPNLPSLSLSGPITLPTNEWSEILQKKIEESNKISMDYIGDCNKNKLKNDFVTESADHVGEAICNQAVKIEATFILVGSRGLGALRRKIMGSVSDYVLHHTKVPVLMIPK